VFRLLIKTFIKGGGKRGTGGGKESAKDPGIRQPSEVSVQSIGMPSSG
jgi:hypothetical protein